MNRAARSGVEIRYEWVRWDQISPNVAIAVVASEDQAFSEHHGFDLRALKEALGEDRERVRGASTISQQVAKNLYLSPERSVVRKGLEAYLTVCLELLWPKRRILEVYLNVAEFGRGIYGVEAASQAFFGKPASRLTGREGALLAVVLPSPRRMSPARPSMYMEGRVGWILTQVRQLGGADYLAGL